MAVFCEAPTLACNVDDARAVAPVGSEHERERELDKYFRSAGIEPVRAGVANALAAGGRSNDATLTALAQLGSLKLQCERSFISLIDQTHQYIIGEATRSHALHSDYTSTPSDAIYLGIRALELHWGVCPTTIQVFTGARKSFVSETITADADHYIIRDFTADPSYRNREYIVSWPYMRSYLEVPLRTKGGVVIGSYCVVDTNPRDFSQRDIITLAEISTCIVDHLNLLRYKQEHDRAQHLIQGLGTIVASSLESPLSDGSALLPAPTHSSNIRLGAQDGEATAPVAVESTEEVVVDVAAERPMGLSSHTVDLSQRFEDFRLNETSPEDASRRQAVSTPPPISETQTRSTHGVLSDQKGKHQRSFDEDEHSILADITELIYKHNDIDGVLVLDAPSETTPADGSARPPSSCKEMGTRLGSDDENVAMVAYRRSKHLSTSVLRGLLYRHPAGKILRREKDAPVLDAFVRSHDPTDLLSDNPVPSPSNDEEHLFEYLGGPLQIILAPMWAATHRNGLLCTVCWTRDRARNFEDEDVALLSAFCNSAVANLARKDAISTMQTKSRFMESISHELRSPIHGILASADLLDEQCTDAGSRSLLTNIQSCGATLLDTMNQLLIYTEMSSTKSRSSSVTGLSATVHDITAETNDDVANNETHVNLGTLVEEVVDAISVSHTLNEVHGKELETERKKSGSIRTIHSVLVPVPTVVTIHPEAAKRVRIQVGAFRRLLMILYSNALQHTSHGHVEVELRLRDNVGKDIADAIQLVVRDSGRGISQRFMDSQMFLPFSQEHATSAGIGLGLNIAQRLVRNLGGTIDVESKEEIGTTMQVTIPLTERMVLQEESGDSTIFFSTVLRQNISGRSVCIMNLVEGHEMPQRRPTPSVYDTTNTVLVRSLKTILSECFGIQIVLNENIAEAFLDVKDGQVFMSSTADLIADGLKIQNPISPRTVAAALVQVFNLSHVLDQETRDLLQIYQPLDLGKTASSLPATAPASTPALQAADSEESTFNTPFNDAESGDINRISTEDTTPSCLLVDDNEVNLKVLGACVQRLGYPHVFAINGEVAVEAFKARGKGFDIVFMDLSMPVLDGFEATKRIREIEAQMEWPPAKIVALSAYGTDESRSKAIECGCDLFLMKPASPRKIRETVQLLLK